MIVRILPPVVAVMLPMTIAPSGAAAYVSPSSFDRAAVATDDPRHGGGGGRHFTGSVADGYTCNVCHNDGGHADWTIEGVPRDTYDPEQTYDIELSWPETAANTALALELITPEGQAAGSVEPPAADEPQLCRATRYAVQGRQVIHTGLCGDTPRTRVRWTPPQDGQRVWFHAVIVQGDAEGLDTTDDDFSKHGRLLRAIGTPEPDAAVARSTCSVAAAGSRGRAPVWAGLVLLGLTSYMRRGRRHGR